MLILAIHTIGHVTAKIPLFALILEEKVNFGKLPPELKLRVMLPTNGTQSASLWDADSEEVLQRWLSDELSLDVSHALYVVEEDFCYGIATSLAQARTATKTKEVIQSAQAKVADAASVAAEKLSVIDEKYHISQKASETLHAAREKTSSFTETLLAKAKTANAKTVGFWNSFFAEEEAMPSQMPADSSGLHPTSSSQNSTVLTSLAPTSQPMKNQTEDIPMKVKVPAKVADPTNATNTPTTSSSSPKIPLTTSSAPPTSGIPVSPTTVTATTTTTAPSAPPSNLNAELEVDASEFLEDKDWQSIKLSK